MAATLVLLWASGWLLHDGTAAEIGDLTDAQRQWHRGAIVTHGVLAWALCGFVGRWVWPHLTRVWPQPAKRPTWVLGLLMAGALAVVATTGLVLLYGAGQWHEAASALHWAFGLPLPLIGIAHGWRWIAQVLTRRPRVRSTPATVACEPPQARSKRSA